VIRETVGVLVIPKFSRRMAFARVIFMAFMAATLIHVASAIAGEATFYNVYVRKLHLHFFLSYPFAYTCIIYIQFMRRNYWLRYPESITFLGQDCLDNVFSLCFNILFQTLASA
jgi:hypothetical protein